ncbi:MAG: ribonuclease III [Rhodospirillaceae bacterium]|nr:ribonuclease III [Rhodospirillaceae bacterium]
MASPQRPRPAHPPARPLEARLGHRFADSALLDQALTHRSVTGQSANAKTRQATNERLEFLGDRVLGLVIADLLLKTFAAENEGQLAQRLAALVAQPTLVAVARELDLGPNVRAAAGQDAEDTDAILADACEAVIGALYLDGGLAVAAGFIARHWTARMDAAIAPPKDAKSALQEWAQGRGLPLPNYRVIDQSGPDHAPAFTVAVAVEGFAEVEGRGRSKRQAETAAAAAFVKSHA